MSIFSDTGTETSDDDIPRKEGEGISSCSMLNVKFYNYM